MDSSHTSVLQVLENHLFQTLTGLYGIDAALFEKIQLTLTTEKNKQNFGDLSTNCALIIGQSVGKNPREVALAIQQTLQHKHIERVEIAGPGFLNIFFTQQAFIELAQELYAQGESFFKTKSPHHSYSIEFVSANPTGPLHIGHGRGGIIGDVLSNILIFLGHSVTKEFYINDAGNQIQKLGESFKARCLQVSGIPAEVPQDGYQGEYLVEIAQQAYSELGAELSVQDDSFYAQYAKDQLLTRLQETLKNYGIVFDVWFSEKSLHDSGAIEQVLSKIPQHLYEQEGATWLRTSAFGDDKDRVIRKKTGELTYIAPDCAYLKNKLDRGFDKLIYILGQDHHSYLTRLKIVMEILGYDPMRLSVILYQLVTVKEGGVPMRLSKRAARLVTLDDIISTVGKDVARFFYLHTKADAHLDFDVELALKHTDENPVYYIQYAYVRTNSILAKAQLDKRFHDLSVQDCIALGESERLILKKISSLGELLQSIEKNHQMHKLTYYAIELAQTFHAYYAHHTVLDTDASEKSRARLVIVDLVRQTLKTTFNLLGISAPDRM